MTRKELASEICRCFPEGAPDADSAGVALASRQNSKSLGTRREKLLRYLFASVADRGSSSKGNWPSLSITRSCTLPPLVSLTRMVAVVDSPLPWKATQQPSHLATRDRGTRCPDFKLVIKLAGARMMMDWSLSGALARANTTPTPSTFTGDPAVSTV